MKLDLDAIRREAQAWLALEATATPALWNKSSPYTITASNTFRANCRLRIGLCDAIQACRRCGGGGTIDNCDGTGIILTGATRTLSFPCPACTPYRKLLADAAALPEPAKEAK